MIFFTGNFLNDLKFKKPVTIVHDYNETTDRAVCSVHELEFLEKYFGEKLVFKPYSVRGYIQYYKPNEVQKERAATINATLVIRSIEKIPENGGLLFNKVD